MGLQTTAQKSGQQQLTLQNQFGGNFGQVIRNRNPGWHPCVRLRRNSFSIFFQEHVGKKTLDRNQILTSGERQKKSPNDSFHRGVDDHSENKRQSQITNRCRPTRTSLRIDPLILKLTRNVVGMFHGSPEHSTESLQLRIVV